MCASSRRPYTRRSQASAGSSITPSAAGAGAAVVQSAHLDRVRDVDDERALRVAGAYQHGEAVVTGLAGPPRRTVQLVEDEADRDRVDDGPRVERDRDVPGVHCVLGQA